MSEGEASGNQLDRRDLLRLTALGGVAALAHGCRPPADRGAPAAAGAGAAAVPAFELDELTVSELAAAMAEGRATAVSLVESYLRRIDEVDRGGPTLRSVIELNPDALEIAAARDEERRAGRPLGPLHGIPVLVKDNLDSADRMSTTAGSLALAGTVAPRDSSVVARLRQAGAVLLGKTNLSEWANFRSTRSSSGWSGRGGQTRNPYALDRNPCGSSSGSGVAVAANLCALAVGTETDGSIVCPATANGVVGIKPTVGLVSRAGIVPISHSQDTAGPMARTVTDAVRMLGAIAGVDPRDEATAASRGRGAADYTPFLRAGGLAGRRLGVWRERMGRHEGVDRVMEEAFAAVRAAGAEIVDPVSLAALKDLGDPEYEVLLYEFKSDLAAYLAGRGADITVRSLADLIAFNDAHAAEEMPYFRQEIFLEAEAKGPLTEEAYLAARRECVRRSRAEGIDRVLAEHRLDAMVAPTGGPAWLTDLVNGDHYTGGSSEPAAIAG